MTVPANYGTEYSATCLRCREQHYDGLNEIFLPAYANK